MGLHIELSARQAATLATTLGTSVLMFWIIAAFDMPDFNNTDVAVLMADPGETLVSVDGESYAPFRTVNADTATSAAAITVNEEWHESEGSATALPLSAQQLPPESPNVQIATLTAADPTPSDAKKAPGSVNALDDCLVSEVCIDEYLWSLYQRTPKRDSIKVAEQRKIKVIKNGKPRTVVQTLTKLVPEDFTWKDPKAADKAGMSLMEYVIGGMNHTFKLKLYNALRAADDAGLGPGITSAFRDDYRQSLASGLKAATNRSYHGGSLRGGYGHGLAADLVSVSGDTDAQRWMACDKLWNWIDVHPEFGIGRPYLDKDPAHVAPIDGKEYADHRRPNLASRLLAKVSRALLNRRTANGGAAAVKVKN
jgi:hypothetical protein